MQNFTNELQTSFKLNIKYYRHLDKANRGFENSIVPIQRFLEFQFDFGTGDAEINKILQITI